MEFEPIEPIEFIQLVNEELINFGLPESELIDYNMATGYINLHYSVKMAIDDIIETHFQYQMKRKINQ